MQVTKLEECILNLGFAAKKFFPKQYVRVWFVMLENNCWKSIVIDTDTKEVLVEGFVKRTPIESLQSASKVLEKMKQGKNTLAK